MYWTEHHVLCCTASHCTQKGANDVVMQLRREVLKRGLDSRILVNTCGTIDLCDVGPNIVVYPEGTIYSGVAPKDVKELVDAIERGDRLERLGRSPELGGGGARPGFFRAFFADMAAFGGAAPADDVTALAARHAMPDGWLDEQARRGFVARKPGADGGPATISVTKKARDRYRV